MQNPNVPQPIIINNMQSNSSTGFVGKTSP